MLPEAVSSKIAAGEVVEGPHSVVRELIDNALDAEATGIKVAVNNGGKDYILVSDNGAGMLEEDALLAIQKHTTSKIANIEDLNTIHTIGFRGEALSSICTVSDFTMVTKREIDDYGTKVVCVYGKDISAQPAAANNGTEITVKNIFQNLPARKKFLGSNRAENAKIKEEILKKAISFYERGFSFKADDRTIYSLGPEKDVRERIGDIFGENLHRNLIDIFHREDLYSLHIYISNKNCTLSNRRSQFFFINRRPVSDRSLFFALNNPTKGIVPIGRYIYAFVFIEIDPSLIDINVHPAKKEIRIKIVPRLFSTMNALMERILREKFYGTYIPETVKYRKQEVQDYRVSFTQSNLEVREPAFFQGHRKVDNKNLGLGLAFEVRGDIFPLLKDLRYRQQLFSTYILFEGDDFLLLIDQHAAHERILYERLRNNSKELNSIKSLLIPINFTPPRGKYDELLSSLDILREAGIEIEPFGEESFNIVSIPAFIPDEKEEEALSLFLEDFYMGKMSLKKEDIKDKFIKLASCRNAVKEGDILTEEEAFTLLHGLEDTEVPYVCPHGRPTVFKIARESIDGVFKRR